MNIKATTLNAPFSGFVTPKPNFLDSIARRAVRSRLGAIEHGLLTLIDGSSVERCGRHTARCALSAVVRVHDVG